jgi:hypothetical protein
MFDDIFDDLLEKKDDIAQDITGTNEQIPNPRGDDWGTVASEGMWTTKDQVFHTEDSPTIWKV